MSFPASPGAAYNQNKKMVAAFLILKPATAHTVLLNYRGVAQLLFKSTVVYKVQLIRYFTYFTFNTLLHVGMMYLTHFTYFTYNSLFTTV